MFLLYPLYQIIWNILVRGPLVLIDQFSNLLNLISVGLPMSLIFNINYDPSKATDVTSALNQFNLHSIPSGFVLLFGVALVIGIILFGIHYISWAFTEDINIKERLVKTLKSSLTAVAITIFIPFGFFLFLIVISFLNTFLSSAILGGGTASNGSIADSIYWIGSGGAKGRPVPSGFPMPSSWKDMNWIVQILATFFMLYTVVMTCVSVLQKVFELFLLFIIGPIIGSTMVSDHGKRMNQWKDFVLAKGLVVASTMMCYNIFGLLMGKMTDPNNPLLENQNFVLRQALILVSLIAGGTFLLTAPTFMANFVGDSVGAAEARNQMASVQHAQGMLKAGAAGLVGAAYLGEKGKQKQAKKLGRSGGMPNSPSGGDGDNSSPDLGSPDSGGPSGGDGSSPLKRGGIVGGATSATGFALKAGFGAGAALGTGVAAVFGSKAAKERIHKKASGAGKGLVSKAKGLGSWATNNTIGHATKNRGANDAAARTKRIQALKDQRATKSLDQKLGSLNKKDLAIKEAQASRQARQEMLKQEDGANTAEQLKQAREEDRNLRKQEAEEAANIAKEREAIEAKRAKALEAAKTEDTKALEKREAEDARKQKILEKRLAERKEAQQAKKNSNKN